MNCHRVCIILLACLVSATSFLFPRQKPLPPFLRDSIDQYVRRGMERWNIPGVAVGVVVDGKAVFLKGYGVREVGRNERVDENTLFMIGSNTKAFTGTAIAMLAADRRLSLDDSVRKFLPDFRLRDPLASAAVTVRDLLCHRIGMETFQGDFLYWGSDLSRQEVMERFGMLKATYSFRSHWGYTNAGFLTAGEIIPVVSGGRTWEQFIRDSILIPLRMNRTVELARDLEGAGNAAKAHTLVEGKLRVIPYGAIDNLAPAATISSSVADMSHWLIAQTDSGRYNGRQVISPAVLQATWTPSSIIGLRGGSRFTRGHFGLYGLGWFLEEYDGRLEVSHTGGVNGFVTSVAFLPEERLGICVFTNTDQNHFYSSIKSEILDACLGLPYRNYDSIAYAGFSQRSEATARWLQAKRDTIDMHLAPALPLTEFTGTYRNELYGTISIEENAGGLLIRFSHHPMTGKLESLGGARFRCTYSDPIMGIREIPFTIEGRTVRAVTIRVDDFVDFTPYLFTKE